MRRGLRHWSLLGLGWAFVVLGIAGLFLPILQGILFLAVGGAILAGESARARLLLRRLRKRYPAFGNAVEAARLKAAAAGRRLRLRPLNGR